MRSVRVFLLILLILPIYCSIEKRERFGPKWRRNSQLKESKGISVKDVVGPVHLDIPLHLSGSSRISDKEHNLFITDQTIGVIRRSYDYYYKWVFTYKSEVKDEIITLKDIVMNDDSSRFYFSSRNDVSGCKVDLGKEYSYKDIKAACPDGITEIEDIISKIKESTQIKCRNGDFYKLQCELNIGDYVTTEEDMDVDAINYVMNDIRIGSFPSSLEITTNSYNSVLKIKEDKMIYAILTTGLYRIYRENVTITNGENYTKIYHIEDKYSDEYICLEKGCDYICNVENFDEEWSLDMCFKKVNDISVYFNNVYKKAYNGAKDYSPAKNIRSKSLDEKEKKEIKATKGYYYEDVKENGDEEGYYKGYFLIDNILTIIAQNGYCQEYIEQLKLVLPLDPDTKSTKFEDENDLDKEKSGVEPKYDDDGWYDESCKSFIPLKDKDTKYSKCEIYFDQLTSEYINREYNITGSGSETKLVIHNIDDLSSANDIIIQLTEYSDSTKLNEIINKITKFTKPIPDGKCLKISVREDGSDGDITLYNNVIYQNGNYKRDNMEMKMFQYKEKENNFYYNDYYFACLDGYDSQYLYNSHYFTFYHKFVDFQGNSYEECNEKLKIDVLKEFEDTVKQFKKEEGISDDSGGGGGNNGIIYTINFLLFSLLLFIFI